ncbi:MAG: caspase family protein [Lewinellaceae bacterium]|nr:caspase family protein [Lewinellaceae bacterium]
MDPAHCSCRNQELLCGVDADSVKFYAENQILKEDKRWKLESPDNLSYNLFDKKTNRLVATLLLGDVFLKYPDEDPYDTETSRIWAVTTPSGRFDASPKMMESLHYVVGMEVIELDQLKARYWEPGLLQKILGLSKGELRNVDAFDNVPLYPLIQANIDKSQLQINLAERSGGIGKLSLFINGTERGPQDINPERKQRLSIDLKTYAKYYYRGDTLNTIALRAYNQEGWLKSQAYELTYQPGATARGNEGFKPKKPASSSGQPSLYAIVVGTSDYAGEDLDLKYADLDAEAMAAALAAAGKELFGKDVHIRLFTTSSNVTAGASGGIQNEMSSKANIQAAFEAYAKPEQAKPNDVLVLYFSGHGITYGEAEKAQFYYLTKDIASGDLSDPEVRRQYTISSDTLTEWIKTSPHRNRCLCSMPVTPGRSLKALLPSARKT